jgi:hypothetical protein
MLFLTHGSLPLVPAAAELCPAGASILRRITNMDQEEEGNVSKVQSHWS